MKRQAKEGTVADNQKGPETPKEEAPAPALTLQAWADEQNLLIDRAIAANLPWGPALATIVAKRGMSLFDQARAGLTAWIDHGLELIESGGNAKTAKK